jgi:rubrerythrin
MQKSLKGSNTEKNLLKAFYGESQAYLRYGVFASIAKKEGLEQISSIFKETSYNEKEHAKRFNSFLVDDNNNELTITETFSQMTLDTTIRNLKYSINGENREHTQIYPQMAKIAKEEGFLQIFDCFNYILIAEKYHEIRFLMLFDNLENDRFFRKDIITRWKCRNCGYIYEAKESFDVCPACLHSQAYIEELSENFNV